MSKLIQFILLSAMVYYLAQASPIAEGKAKTEDSIATMEKLEKMEKAEMAGHKDHGKKEDEDDDDKEVTTTTTIATTTEKHEIEFEKDEHEEHKKADDKKEVEDEKKEEEKKEVEKKEDDKKEDDKKEDDKKEDDKKVEDEEKKVKERRGIPALGGVAKYARSVESVKLHSDEEVLNVTQWGQNPCDNNRNFNYYVPYPNDTSRYIQCDPWGTGIIKTCSKGLVWSMWALKCDDAKNIHNTTLILPHKVFNCSMSGQQCLNGGVCTESSLGGDRCVCKPDWTGPTCESRVDYSDITHRIINGTFSIEKFRHHVANFNISTDVSEYARYKDILDNKTYAALSKYLALYKGREVRYDTLLNTLIESILDNIYPDAAFLSTFNSSSVSVVELVQLIPNLMSYSKYSLERYQDVFAKYQQVLTCLVDYLNSTKNTLPSLRREAIQYTELTTIFMNQTTDEQNVTADASLSFVSDSNRHLTDAQVRESLRIQFNTTMNITQRLFSGLEKFQTDVMKLVQNNTRDVFSLNLKDSKLSGTQEVKEMLDQIVASGNHIWESLVNYGFWFVTSVYSGLAQPTTV